MQLFTGPATHRRVLESAIALAVAEIGNDVKRRESKRPGIVPDSLLDYAAEGRVYVQLVETCDDEGNADHLHAFAHAVSPITR